jgi:exodeoxyribonuclease-3
MKLVSWNVNGLRAVVQKGFEEIFTNFDADIFCLQETKLSDCRQLDLEFDGYQSYWNFAEKKGYSGTAIYTRLKPIKHTYGIGLEEHNHEGRVVTLEFDDFFMVNVYTPNSQSELARLDYRMAWERDFKTYLKALDARKPVIVCGDLNVAHNEIDLKNPKSNHGNPGFSDEERAAFTSLLSEGFSDTFRTLYPNEQQFSWWSYRYNARAKNIGWRIDYFLVSNRLMERVTDAAIHSDVMGSDHCPVSLTLK